MFKAISIMTNIASISLGVFTGKAIQNATGNDAAAVIGGAAMYSVSNYVGQWLIAKAMIASDQ